jgi:drug/metabolite transporter (DMT)-like permease
MLIDNRSICGSLSPFVSRLGRWVLSPPPAFGLAVAYLMLDEKPTVVQWVDVLIVVTSLAIARSATAKIPVLCIRSNGAE